MSRGKDGKPAKSSLPEYHGTNKYTYVVNAELADDKDVLVRRERWTDNRYHTAARDSLGHFIATRRWGKRSTIKSFTQKYKNPTRTLTVTSPKNYNMSSKRNQQLIFNRITAKYNKYPLKNLEYRFTYDSVTGTKVTT